LAQFTVFSIFCRLHDEQSPLGGKDGSESYQRVRSLLDVIQPPDAES
jgi:hypothetical protein